MRPLKSTIHKKEIVMANEPDSGKPFKTNALVSKLLEAGSETAITLTGFITQAGRQGYIRLILGLNNLSRSIEIR